MKNQNKTSNLTNFDVDSEPEEDHPKQHSHNEKANKHH